MRAPSCDFAFELFFFAFRERPPEKGPSICLAVDELDLSEAETLFAVLDGLGHDPALVNLRSPYVGHFCSCWATLTEHVR